MRCKTRKEFGAGEKGENEGNEDEVRRADARSSDINYVAKGTIIAIKGKLSEAAEPSDQGETEENILAAITALQGQLNSKILTKKQRRSITKKLSLATDGKTENQMERSFQEISNIKDRSDYNTGTEENFQEASVTQIPPETNTRVTVEGAQQMVNGYIRVTVEEDLNELRNNDQISDVIMDAYLNNLQLFPTIKCSFAYVEQMVWSMDEEVLKQRNIFRYVRGDISSAVYLFIPIFQGADPSCRQNHFTLAAYYLPENRCIFYDSLRGPLPQHIRSRLELLLQGLRLHPTITTAMPGTYNTQNDGVNCGIYVLHTITRLVMQLAAYEIGFNAYDYRNYVYEVVSTMGQNGQLHREPPSYFSPTIVVTSSKKAEQPKHQLMSLDHPSISHENRPVFRKRKLENEEKPTKRTKVQAVIEKTKSRLKDDPVKFQPNIKSSLAILNAEKKMILQKKRDKNLSMKKKLDVTKTEEQKLKKQLADARKTLKQIKLKKNETMEAYRLRIAGAREKENRIKFILRPRRFLRAAEDDKEDTDFFRIQFTKRCPHCNAIKTTREAPGLCCQKGKVRLEPFPRVPSPLEELYTAPRFPNRSEFIWNIRRYNASLALSCIRDNKDKPEYIQHGNKGGSLRIVGKIEHQYYDLHPRPGRVPIYGQLYYLDTEEAIRERKNVPVNFNLNPNLMWALDKLVRENHALVQTYINMAEKEREEIERARKENRKTVDLAMKIILPDWKKGLDRKTYALPKAQDIAIIYRPGIDNRPEHPGYTVFLKQARGESKKTLDIISPFVDATAYVLIFIYGTFGYNPYATRGGEGKRQRISMREYYCFYLFFRNGDNKDYYMHSQSLFQQFIVDACVRVDANQFRFYKKHQEDLCKEKLNVALDGLEMQNLKPNVRKGMGYFLPSNYQGCYQFVRTRYIHMLAIMRQFGKPDFFITFTCNQNWPEIVNTIRRDLGETAYNRPDVTVRVMHEKLELFVKIVKEEEVLGPVAAMMCIVEFQKRGLPHVHCLVIRDRQHKLDTAEEVDTFITAEIPNKEEDPLLYDLIANFQIHGPCGHLGSYKGCQVEETKLGKQCLKCGEKFPKEFAEETKIIKNDFPKYRRPNNGRSIKTKYGPADNRFIVSTNKYLLKSMQCHINVEQCASLNSATYLAKYFSKPPEKAAVQFYEMKKKEELERRRKNPENEGKKDYQILDERRDIDFIEDVRIITSMEATQRILKLPLQKMSVVVHTLPVHDEYEQTIYIHCDGDEETEILRKAEQDTPVTGYFKLVQNDGLAHELTYREIPRWYTWDDKTHAWNSRGKEDDKVVSILHPVSVRSKLFYLRTLLLHRKGMTSFEHLRTVDGIVYEQYIQACMALNLFESNQEWENCLEQATPLTSANNLRYLFATIVTYCKVHNATRLFDKFKDALSDDMRGRKGRYLAAFQKIEAILTRLNKNANELGLYYPDNIVEEEIVQDMQTMNLNEVHIEPEEERMTTQMDISRMLAGENMEKLNEGQKTIFDAILAAIRTSPHDTSVSRLLRILGSAGTGKTFLINTIIHYLISEDCAPVVAASTGTAATLLYSGKTAHSALGIPLIMDESRTSVLSRNSPKAKAIERAKVIIIDEVTMLTKFVMSLIDRLLRDLCDTEDSMLPFGGKVVIIGGDFKQLPPVIPNGSRAEIVNQSMCSSEFFPLFEPLKLSVNMRAGPHHQAYAEWLQKLGTGRLNDGKGFVELPDEIIVDKMEELLDFTFDGFRRHLTDEEWSSRCILSPKNVDTSDLNEIILQRMHSGAQIFEYFSNDEPLENDQLEEVPLAKEIPIEQYHHETPSGFPPHVLRLKFGLPVMLLRNLDTDNGLVNGTKLCVAACLPNLVQVRVINGKSKGMTLALPRMHFETPESKSVLKMPFIRTQFPIIPASAMTINKAQGQTYRKVGLNLQVNVFEHGQLYVAFSRVSTFDDVRVFTGGVRDLDGKVRVKNIIYKELLNVTE